MMIDIYLNSALVCIIQTAVDAFLTALLNDQIPGHCYRVLFIVYLFCLF